MGTVGSMAGLSCGLLLLGVITAFPLGSPASAYTRPYGANAAWNMPVLGLPRHTRSDELSLALWNQAPARPGDFNLSFDEYTYPVYEASEAVERVPVVTRWRGNLAGKTIPWNPAWRPAAGADAQVIILDSSTGREWNLWQASFDGTYLRATNGNLVSGDFRTKSDGFAPSRGCGIQYLAMLVRPQEIAQGAIEHALSMPIRNVDGRRFSPPATKLERPHGKAGIPLGTRFALDVTGSQIDSWIASLPGELPETARLSARRIAHALRTYGWFITDSSGGAHLQFESRASAEAAWSALGLDRRVIGNKEYPRDLLDGLMKPERIYALAAGASRPPR